MPFYTGELSTLQLWYPWVGVLEPIPHRYQGSYVLGLSNVTQNFGLHRVSTPTPVLFKGQLHF